MNIKNFFVSLKLKWELAVIVTMLTATFGLYINFFLPHYYQAQSQFLIVQKQSPTIDAYTAIKGSEQLAYTFKQIVLSPAFFERVSMSKFDIKTSYFGQEPRKIVKKWQKAIIVETIPNTGILKINVFHPDQKEAQKISQTISYIITNERNLFLGDNQEMNMLILGKTIVSNMTVKPNAIANTFFGLITGLLISIGLTIFFPNKDLYNIKKNSLRSNTMLYKKKTTIKAQAQGVILRKKTSAPANLPII